MKRLLQGLAIFQIVLTIALVVRIVGVWRTPLPEFSEIPELPAESSLPPARPAPKIPDSLTDAVVKHDLFDEQRGENPDILVEGGPTDQPPVAPPSTVKLMGVMFVGEEPVGILLDTNVKPEQQSVRKGEMFGEYEVGDITPLGLTLLGSGGQQFQVPLKIEAAAPGAVAAAPQVMAGQPARPGAPAVPGRPVTPPHPAPVPNANRPVTAKPIGQAAAAPEQKAMSARERAQAIAQRNADLRKTGQGGQRGAGEGENKEGGSAPDPVQARLEALRQLREAAKNH